MSGNNGGLNCTLGCWAMAAGIGLLLAILLLVFDSTGFIGAIFLGGLAFVILGLLFTYLFCRSLPALGTVTPGEDTGMRAVTKETADGTHGASAGSAAGMAGAATSGKASGAAAGGSDADTGAAGMDGSADAGTGGDAGAVGSGTSEAAGAGTSEAAAAAGSTIQPSKALAGEQELSERKGSWKYGEDAAAGGADASGADAAGGAEAAGGAGDAGAGSDTGAAAVSDVTAQAAAVDGPGTKPEALDGPRGGTADDLKRIKGIGPKLEKLCNSLGFYHFDQIASWQAEEVAWVDQNLQGFKGRVTRDDWVKQAGQLAAGEETEFSKKVDKGGIY